MKKLIAAIICISLFAGCTKDPIDNIPSSLKNGLVAYYPFNGNANDESGNGNNGTVNGATLTTDRFGNVGKAYSFDGASSHISVKNSQSLNPSSISISIWFNPSLAPLDVEAQARALIAKWNQIPNCGSDGENYNLVLSRYNNINVLSGGTSINNSISNALKSPSDLIGINVWRHVVFVHNEITGQKLYINGNLIASNSISGALCGTNNNLLIGADNNFNSIWRSFFGKIDNIRIYNRALTQQEITWLANN